MDFIGQSNFLQALGWAVLNSLWQMALLWVLYQLFTGIFRKANASQQSFLAVFFLLSGFGWFVYTFFSIYINSHAHETVVTAGLVHFSANAQLNRWLDQTLPLASVIYLILLIAPLIHFIRNYRFVKTIRKNGLTKAAVEWRIFVERIGARLGIKKTVKVWVSSLVNSPVTIGYLKPIILLPLAAVNHLSTHQLEAVLLHELAHIRRFDYFINLLMKFVQSVLYYNPFVNAFVKIVEREREKSCDEMVMQFQYDPHGYATALLVLEQENYVSQALAVAASGKKHDLLHRIEFIMGVKKKRVVSYHKLGGVLAGLLCIIGLNALVMLSRPAESTNDTASFASIASPLYFFTDVTTPSIVKDAPQAVEEVAAATIVNEAKQVANAQKQVATVKKTKATINALADKLQYIAANPYAVTASFVEDPAIPELKEYQEKQVMAAVDASKRVIEEGQWKEMEKKLAEVFTQQQKEQLKSQYKQEMNKMDWKKWEDRLRLSYDNVDWETVNNKLGTAVTNIRIDSLGKVYTKALTNLSIVQNKLIELNIEAVPDTEISLHAIEVKRSEVQKALSQLRAISTKKIVRL